MEVSDDATWEIQRKHYSSGPAASARILGMAQQKYVPALNTRSIHLISAELRERILKFRKDRDWEQFHSARTLAIALSVEAGELLEHFQWISEQDVSRLVS